jgi:CheY-like chemotaxis protein
MKILAVDDDRSILELLPIILAEAGITDVTVASSAQDALSVISNQAEPFECFLLDIQMPGGSGIELCRAIRKLPAYEKIPIIMLTAMQEKSFIDDSFVAGATDYTTKPFDIAELCARVRMAKLLVDEQRKVQKLSRVFGKSDRKPADKPEADFTAAINIGGVKGLIPKQALTNYVAQLSRAGSQPSTFFAIHIESCRQIFDKGTPSEFEYALRHSADAIMASPMLETAIMCYVGSGNFICCSNIATLHPADRLESDIQNILDDKDLTYTNGSPLDVEIAVGAAVQPLLSRPLQLHVLEPQAIERAMVRVEAKRDAPAVPNIRRIPI